MNQDLINQISKEARIISKPWGEETIYTADDLKYTFKKIKINAGCKLSLQSHDEKVETFVLISGKAKLVIGSDINNLDTIDMELMKGYSIPLNAIHRMMTVDSEAVVLEGSTPETGVTIRYQDDYNRPNETEEMRKLENRGWKQS